MFKKAVIISLAGLCFSAAGVAAEPGRQYVPAPAPAGNEPALPFSEGVMAGGIFYVAGHIGMDPATHKVGATADAEARLVMDAVKQTLAAGGLTMDDLVSVTVYCTDLGLYDSFNSVYRTYFHGRVSRACVHRRRQARARRPLRSGGDGGQVARGRSLSIR